MRKILLLGGTGAMGNHLQRLLQNKKAEVYVTSRSNWSDYNNIHFIQGNARKMSFIQELLKQDYWDVIVDFMVYHTEEFRLKAPLLLKACKQYVFLSSARVYADTQGLITEDTPRLLDVTDDLNYLQTDEYALSKAREENILFRENQKNWTIVRPYITYSEIRLQLGVLEKETWLYRAVHNRTLVFSEDIASKITTLTYGLDVARGIYALIGEEKALGQVFHITTSENHTWQEIFDVYLDVLEKHLGHRPKVKMIPYNPRVNITESRAQVIYDRYFNRKFDTSKISQYIDVSTFKPTLTGVRECLEEFLQNPSYRMNGWGEHAMYDRIAGEWTPLTEIPSWEKRAKYLLRRTILAKK
ncbi:MAG: NAD-dependent epimerase/dehydratase family protein [Prevotella sp.]|jgi:nucleoside-diphosphate-sugar epimerase